MGLENPPRKDPISSVVDVKKRNGPSERSRRVVECTGKRTSSSGREEPRVLHAVDVDVSRSQ